MRGLVRLGIERLAPTGEGIAHLEGKTVFVEGALPGECVDAEIFEVKARFAKARTRGVNVPSPDRREVSSHAARCGGTDWAHFDPRAAREAKRHLFLETLLRIGGIAADDFGDLPISESPMEYRLRNQFHVLGGVAGFFEKHSHRIVALDECEIVSAPTRAKTTELARSLRPGESPETIESVETVAIDGRHEIAFWNRTRGQPVGDRRSVEVCVDDAAFTVSARSFFQVNRFRSFAVLRDVEALARRIGGASLDAYSGVGFFTHALASAGCSVTAVEASASSRADAEKNRERLARPDDVRIVDASVERFLEATPETFDLVLADPPRSGLGRSAPDLAGRARHTLLYVSCDPASLARDLRTILPLGFEIENAVLEDFFPLTHRVEALVTLRRRA